MGCTQGNIGHYERGQTVPPDAARRLIDFAQLKGLEITFDDVYGNVSLSNPERRNLNQLSKRAGEHAILSAAKKPVQV